MLFQKLSGKNISPGGLFAWGNGASGATGFGDVASRSLPAQLGTLTTWTAVGTGNSNSSGVTSDGKLWTWGSNPQGQLGQGDVVYRSVPTQVGTLTNWSTVSSWRTAGFAIGTDGKLWAIGGSNTSVGIMGLGDRVSRSSPVQVGTLATWSKVSSSDYRALAIKTDGTLWAWGNNTYGQLGLGDGYAAGNHKHRSSPVQIGTLATWSQVGVGRTSSVGVKTNGTLWAWGQNHRGQLGLSDTVYRSSPVQIGTLITWSKVGGGKHAAFAVKTDGTLWAWGNNDSGHLGLGDAYVSSSNRKCRSSPVQVGALTNWASVSPGNWVDTVLALKTDSTLWAWGNNDNGPGGFGDTISRSSPVQVGPFRSWSKIPPNASSNTLAIKNSGV